MKLFELSTLQLINLYKNKNGNIVLRLKHRIRTYIGIDVCVVCGELYLKHSSEAKYCGRKCSNSGNQNPAFGRTGDKHPMYGVYGENHPTFGLKRFGKESPRWKGGVKKKKLPLYDTYAIQLSYAEDVRRDPNNKEILQVKCSYHSCQKWFIPKQSEVFSRINSLIGRSMGEGRFYCSKECKNNCNIFGKQAKTLMKIDMINAGLIELDDLNRTDQYELKKMVLKRDNHECQICGNKLNLKCHHIDPVGTNPLISADVDVCITLCDICHKNAHKQTGCTPMDIRLRKNKFC